MNELQREFLNLECVSPRSYSHLYGLTPLPIDLRVKVLLWLAAAASPGTKEDTDG